jgi:hypothetical protein
VDKSKILLANIWKSIIGPLLSFYGLHQEVQPANPA